MGVEREERECMCECMYFNVRLKHSASKIMLQCVAVCCSVLQCVAVCCSVLQWDTVRVCVMTYSRVCHTHSFVWRALFIHMVRGIHVCGVTHSYVCHDSFVCVS